MPLPQSPMAIRTWSKDQYLISTDASLISAAALGELFDTGAMYWAISLPVDQIRQMLDASLCFGLFELTSASEKKFIGLARVVTDSVTFVYLTDVWVHSAYQGKGIGSWLVKCVQEVFEGMPHLRRSLLFTGDWERSVPFYERLMGMSVMNSQPGQGLAVMERKGRGHPSYGREGSSYN